MKRWFTLSLLTLIAIIFTSATSHAQYRMGAHYIGVNATVVTEPVGWGINYEFGFDENIGLGLVIRYWGFERGPFPIGSQTFATKKRTVIMPLVQASYHFLPKERFDAYGGVRVGYSIFDETVTTEGFAPYSNQAPIPENGITMSMMGGFRYFVSSKISIDGTLEYFLMNDEDYFDNQATSALMFSVNFTLD
jgi:opacity protein-like surface antigen